MKERRPSEWLMGGALGLLALLAVLGLARDYALGSESLLDRAAKAEPARARELAAEVLSRNPLDLRALHLHGRALMELGDLEGAERDLARGCALAPKEPAFWRLRAQVAGRRSASAAIALLDEGLRHAPRDGGMRLQRAALRVKTGDLDGAAGDVDMALTLGVEPVAAHFERARIRERRGELAGAAEDYEWVLARAPELAGAWQNLGQVRLRQGEHEAAVEALDRAVWLDPSSAGARVARAGARLALRRPGGALHDAQVALMADERSGEAWLMQGRALLALGRPEPAVAALERGLAVGSRPTPTRFLLALACERSGALERALEWAERIAAEETLAPGERAQVERLLGHLRRRLRRD